MTNDKWVHLPSPHPITAAGEPERLQLARKRVKYETAEWLTLHLTFPGDQLTTQAAGVTAKAKHAVFAEEKAQPNFIAFEGEIGLRKVLVVM